MVNCPPLRGVFAGVYHAGSGTGEALPTATTSGTWSVPMLDLARRYRSPRGSTPPAPLPAIHTLTPPTTRPRYADSAPHI